MRTLIYWYAQDMHNDAYSLIAKTRQEVVTAKDGMEPLRVAEFGPVEKKMIKYTDVFDLFHTVTGEGGGRGVGKTL